MDTGDNLVVVAGNSQQGASVAREQLRLPQIPLWQRVTQLISCPFVLLLSSVTGLVESSVAFGEVNMGKEMRSFGKSF